MRFNHEGVISEITTLPGNPQTCIFHAVFLRPDLRGKGLGTKAHKARMKEARTLGYNYALCTVTAGNTAQKRILERNGWRNLDTFASDRSGGDILIYGKAL